MDIFDLLTMIGGLCLFLFGMNIMGDGLERRAGNSLKTLLGKLTDSKINKQGVLFCSTPMYISALSFNQLSDAPTLLRKHSIVFLVFIFIYQDDSYTNLSSCLENTQSCFLKDNI